MSTASTSYTLDDAISKLKFGLSTRLEEKSERILNDDEILGLEKILYKLDRELATTKSKERQMASRYIAFNKQLTGFREMFTRYRHAREAYSMAKTYESNIRREAADAQMRAMREKYSRKQQRKQEQLREDRTRTRSTEATLTISTSDRISPELIQLMGTLKKPAILCPIGKTPRIPKGFKPAYLIYYERDITITASCRSQVSNQYNHPSGNASAETLSSNSDESLDIIDDGIGHFDDSTTDD